MGLCGAKHHDKEAQRIFNAIDVNMDGTLTKEEVADWIADERFALNPYFLHLNGSTELPTLQKTVDTIYERMDRAGTGAVTLQDIRQWLDDMPASEYKELKRAVHENLTNRRQAAIHRVFAALDRDRTGRLTHPDVEIWLQNEKAWKDLGNSYRRKAGIPISEEHQGLTGTERKHILKSLDEDRRGYIKEADLQRFFADWSIKDIRRFSEDQRVFAEVSDGEYLRKHKVLSPTSAKEAKEIIQVVQQDHDYQRQVDRVLRHQRRSSKYKRAQKKGRKERRKSVGSIPNADLDIEWNGARLPHGQDQMAVEDILGKSGSESGQKDDPGLFDVGSEAAAKKSSGSPAGHRRSRSRSKSMDYRDFKRQRSRSRDAAAVTTQHDTKLSKTRIE